jgi:hexosaminidase
VSGAVATDPVSIIPRPLKVTHLAGEAGLNGGAVLSDGLIIVHDKEFRAEAEWFQGVLEAGTGWAVGTAISAGADGGVIELRREALSEFAGDLASAIPEVTRHEAYRLCSTAGRVVIAAIGAAGAFYGLQTLRQLFPEAVFAQAGRSDAIVLPELEILDAPRLVWRGVHIDLSRHFMPKSFLLKLIDLAAHLKCNVFHMHLTDDQGWRIEIERYPRLTATGAWRRESALGYDESEGFDGIPHGGFYTREDLTEIVAFAAERHVDVLAEIDMPGHMQAAIASYPGLGNTSQPVEVRTEWGASPHVLNLEETTLQFCRDVIDEVVHIFPWNLVHLGGDECSTEEWAQSEHARQLMSARGFTDVRQLQGWFTAVMAEHLATRGRRLVGWGEILEGGAPEGAIVMSWEDERAGVQAAALDHDVVMTPQEWLYFDRPYSTDPGEPPGFAGATSTEKVYGYDPVPEAIPPSHRHRVLGSQCLLWTEMVSTPERAAYLYFPRLCAFAEIVWTIWVGAESKSYVEFESRLERYISRLVVSGVNHRPLAGPMP